MKHKTGRILYDAVLISSLFIAPFWVTMLLGAAGFFLFPSFYEGIAAGVLLDIVYGIEPQITHPGSYIHTIIILLLFALSLRLRRHLRFYP